MAFPVVARATNYLVTAANWNADIVDNVNALQTGAVALASQAQFDLMYASSATQWARIANGTTGQVMVATTGAAPSWSSTAALLAGRLTVTNTASEQLVVKYDASNYFSVSVGSTGITTLSAVGTASGARLVIPTIDGLTILRTAAEQLVVKYDASNYLSTTVGATGALTLQPVGAGAAVNLGAPTNITGALTVSTTIKERGRTLPMHEWDVVTHSAANFTASSGTWTVASGDQVTFAYHRAGTSMMVAVHIQTSDISATPTYLQIAVPDGASPVRSMSMPILAVNNGTQVMGFAQVEPSVNFIRLYLVAGAWAISAGNAGAQFMFEFQV